MGFQAYLKTKPYNKSHHQSKFKIDEVDYETCRPSARIIILYYLFILMSIGEKEEEMK